MTMAVLGHDIRPNREEKVPTIPKERKVTREKHLPKNNYQDDAKEDKTAEPRKSMTQARARGLVMLLGDVKGSALTHRSGIHEIGGRRLRLSNTGLI